jgi:CheY-like chemotaxis protein
MRILLLDDSDVRHAKIEQVLGEHHEVLHAFNIEEAKQIINICQPLGLLLLDHDLGIPGEDGSMFAGFILNELDTARFPASAIVISHNPPGAENAASKLRTAGIHTRTCRYSDELVEQLTVELTEN